jgi:hypothetical protein
MVVALGGNKGSLTIIDLRSSDNEPVLNLQPHSEKIFNIAWN